MSKNIRWIKIVILSDVVDLHSGSRSLFYRDPIKNNSKPPSQNQCQFIYYTLDSILLETKTGQDKMEKIEPHFGMCR